MILKERKHIIVAYVSSLINVNDMRLGTAVAQLGAGELLVTSMGHDGMKQGFDIDSCKIKSL